MPPEPRVLAFDTSVAHCAAALLNADKMVVSRSEAMAVGQAERLMVLLDEVLAEAGIAWADLDAIGVGIGPGNFTGIRISVAAARGLALALGIPAIGVSGLEALAFGASGPVTSVIDAKRDQVYAQKFPAGIPQLTTRDLLSGPTVSDLNAPIAELIARIAATRLGASSERPAPLYLREADAAPSRQQALRITS